jgi:hypothetical protein
MEQSSEKYVNMILFVLIGAALCGLGTYRNAIVKISLIMLLTYEQIRQNQYLQLQC